jgi:hypothetical protein
MKSIRLVAMAAFLGWSSLSVADECPRGQICNLFEQIMNQQGGPLAGGFAGSTNQMLQSYQIQQKATCELKGNCSDEQRLMCSRVVTSVVPGVVECWGSNDRNFSLMSYKTGELVSNTRSYDVVTNLSNNNTGHEIMLAKKTYGGYVVFDENGNIIADGDALGCDNFVAAGDDTLSCMRGNKKFNLKISDLQKAQRSSASVKDFGADVSVNLCAAALAKISAERRNSGMPNFLKKIFLGKNVSFDGLTDKKIDIVTNDPINNTDAPTCSIAPDGRKCASIYLTKKGLECSLYGKVEYVKEMTVSDADLVAAAKKYVFNGKEVVSMSDIYSASGDRPSSIRIDRPDYLIGSTNFIVSAVNPSVRSSSGTR